MKNISPRYYSSGICMQIPSMYKFKTALPMLAFFLNGTFTDQSAKCIKIFWQQKTELITAGKQKRCWR